MEIDCPGSLGIMMCTELKMKMLKDQSNVLAAID